MQPNLGQSPRSRQSHDWRGARGLVIEGHVVARGPGAGRPATSAPRWGAALEAAAALSPMGPRVTRIALPAGLALVAIAVLALSPGEAERHGAAEPTVRVAAGSVAR